MRSILDCIPCLYNQILMVCRMSTEDEAITEDIIKDYLKMVSEIDSIKKGPYILYRIISKIKEKTGVMDPYREFKNSHIDIALNLYPFVKKTIQESDDPLKSALVASAAGNAIDAALDPNLDAKAYIKKAISSDFGYSDYELFKERLKKNAKILFIADNAEESVFDKLLIEFLSDYDLDITYAVRDEPVYNDITLEDAKKIDFGENVNLISSGCKAPGMLLDQASDEFLKAFNTADIIVSKGQGNFEALLDNEAQIFFLLKIKCDVVSQILSLEQGSLIFKLNNADK